MYIAGLLPIKVGKFGFGSILGVGQERRTEGAVEWDSLINSVQYRAIANKGRKVWLLEHFGS